MQRFVNCLLLSLFLVFTFLTVISWAQTPTGTISGVIIDQSGAVISGAVVTIRNPATGFERKLTSAGDGTFSAPSLLAGEYAVSVERSNFRTYQREVTVTTGSIIKVEIHLEVGQMSEVMTVEATGAAQLNYESHTIDGLVTRQKIEGL